ncbi:MAG: Levansucrase [Stenotrophomonas maltophilia]|nr:MAG: Levansucrase [Stenotrophomonas maltophilia]
MARFATLSRILVRRCLCLLLLPLFLAACDSGDKPAKAPTPAAPVSAPAAPASVPEPKPAAPAPVVSPPPAAKPASPAPVAKTSTKTTPPDLPSKPKPSPKPTGKSLAKIDPVVKKPLPPVKLNLKLPKEALHEQPLADSERKQPINVEKPLLPQLFQEKPKEDSDFQIGGRLIEKDYDRGNDDSWHSQIQGAELQFHFRN